MKKNYFLVAVSFLIYLETVGQSLCDLDKSKMIPLVNSPNGYFTIKLKGNAIKGNIPYEIIYDTGSWSTSIPKAVLDTTKIKFLKRNIQDDWGNLADLVSGQLLLESTDGTPYLLDDYVFYATKTNNYPNSILGAFPSIEFNSARLPSVPYALSLKYATNNMGVGIISNCLDDINKNWNSLKLYLKIGNDSTISNKLNFRTDIPNWSNIPTEFQPEAVTGFKVKITFPDTDKSIETTDLMGTIDTGAPILTVRLGSDDPQNQSIFSTHFVKQGAWQYWGNNEYLNNAKTLLNANVTVQFTDSQGLSNTYQFPVNNNPYINPNTLFAGNYNSGVPYILHLPEKPVNRFNLGNTIYFYCPVVFFDIENKKIGIGFRNKCQLNAVINTPNGTSFCNGSSVNILANANGLNTPYGYKWKQGANTLNTTTTFNVTKAGNYTLVVTDKIGCTDSTSVKISENPLPNAVINKSGATDLLNGKSVILSVQNIANQTYQWFKNGIAINGATNSSYTVNNEGKYSVMITANGCSVTSETVIANLILSNELPNESNTFKVYPNPFENMIKVNFHEPLIKSVKLNLINSAGTVIKEWTTNQKENSFDISGLPSGIYILKCETNNYIKTVKLIKN